MQKILWKDSKSILILLIILYGSFSVFMLWLLLNIPKKSILERIMIGCLLISFLGVIFLILLRTKLSYVTREGIYLGNVMYVVKKKQKRKNRILIRWEQISKIEIIARLVKAGGRGLKWDYLSIQSKNGETNNCIIYDAKGFLQTLKKMDKTKLYS